MPFGVNSEVGRLRQVMVHRPGLEHTRLTPANAAELLFDDVLWVARAKAEHDMFCEAMRDRGVEVFEAEDLLAQALASPEARDWVCGHILNEREVGITAAQRAAEWVGSADPAVVAEFLIGGITKTDVAPGRGAGVGVGRSDVDAAAAAAELLVPARPVVLDLRRGHDQPDDQAARKPETMIMEAIYRFSPMFAAEEFPVWLGGAARTGAARTWRAATCSRSGTAR